MKTKVTLRQWSDKDLPSLAALNADPEVMKYFVATLNFDESKQFMQRMAQYLEENGWGFWAVEVDGELAGLTGLAKPKFETHFTPCVEIGWRFHKKFWGQGIAIAAARQAEAYAFNTLKLEELVSFTAETNHYSRRLMERLGFTRNPEDDFLHPSVDKHHPLVKHVLYRKPNPAFTH